jgi:hypothetical protein
MTFLRLDGGMAIALDRIAKISDWPDRKGLHTVITTDDREFLVTAHTASNTVISMVAADAWECLTVITDDDRRPADLFIQPILAWGLNLFGDVLQITPDELKPEDMEPFALRKTGCQTIYVPYQGVFNDPKAWLSDLRKDFDQAQAKKASRAPSV